MTLPEGRQPLSWQDMPFADRPKAHPSTERLEIEKLQARVAELEARVAAADALADACEIMAEGSLSGASGSVSMKAALAAYQATKEGE